MQADVARKVLLALGQQRKALTLGVTGHQDLGSRETIAWISEQMVAAIRRLSPARGVTSLAIGADQLFASVLLEERIPYTALIPCDRYDETFVRPSDLSLFRVALANAADVTTLPYSAPSEEAFFAAGKAIAERSDLLIAVWNGLPARGLGGTADIVNYALGIGRRVLHIHPGERTASER